MLTRTDVAGLSIITLGSVAVCVIFKNGIDVTSTVATIAGTIGTILGFIWNTAEKDNKELELEEEEAKK